MKPNWFNNFDDEKVVLDKNGGWTYGRTKRLTDTAALPKKLSSLYFDLYTVGSVHLVPLYPPVYAADNVWS